MTRKRNEITARIPQETLNRIRKQMSCKWYYNGGDCGKGLPGTPCHVVGCAAMIPTDVNIFTTPDTRPYDLGHGSFEKGYQPSGIQDPIKEAALDLVDAVDRYTMGRCLRSELLNKNNELKRLLNDN